eukprot:4811308-Prymnesium_polylepis.1
MTHDATTRTRLLRAYATVRDVFASWAAGAAGNRVQLRGTRLRPITATETWFAPSRALQWPHAS